MIKNIIIICTLLSISCKIVGMEAISKLYNESLEQLDHPEDIKYWRQRRSEICDMRIKDPWEWNNLDKNINFWAHRDLIFAKYENAYWAFVQHFLPRSFQEVCFIISSDYSDEVKVIYPIGVSFYKALKITYIKTKILAEFHSLVVTRHTCAHVMFDQLSWAQSFLGTYSFLDLQGPLDLNPILK